VTVDSKTKVLNAPLPTLTGTIAGIKFSDNIMAAYSTTATSTSSVGSYPITALLNDPGNKLTNYDVMNNASTLTITYALAGATCSGDAGHAILQPINPDGTSVFKQGSTVPAKFRVCDANGVSIGTAGVVSLFKLVATSAGTVGPLDETVVSTTPDTAFRWSSTDQQWIFNINTKNLQSSKTYTYEITLNDNTKISFKFGLK
jgi:hypothetical protein